jgi:N-acetylmuramoyl-L-alanine amidase CwlA
LEIKQDFIQTNQTYRSVLPYYLVVHDTGDPGGTDTNEHDYFAGGNRNASADVFVDKDSITQIINTDIDYSWHCGDGAGVYGIKNSNSMGIEMCLEADGTLSEETIENTLYVVKYFMDKYNIPLERIVRHYDASRKCCPAAMSKNNWAPWYDFKNRLANYSGSGPVISSGNWILEDNKWWYLRANKTYPKDCWELINNKWYLFDAS